MEKMRLLNTYVNNVTLDEAVEFLLQKIREQTPAYVVEVNVDVVVKMETDLVLRQITDNADLTLVDGQPLIWISKLYGRPLKMKVSGSDLVPTLLQAAAKEGRSVFVLGGKEDAARKAAENIKARYPGLVMAGALSPSMGFEKKPEEVAYIRETLQKVKPTSCWPVLAAPSRKNGSANITATVHRASRSAPVPQWIFWQEISSAPRRCSARMDWNGSTAL